MQLTTREKSLTVVRSSAEIADQGSAELLRAFAMLSRRGTGLGSWAAPFRHDPIAFLLDSVSDATNLWGPAGELLYRNRAAAELDIGYPSEAPREASSRWAGVSSVEHCPIAATTASFSSRSSMYCRSPVPKREARNEKREAREERNHGKPIDISDHRDQSQGE